MEVEHANVDTAALWVHLEHDKEGRQKTAQEKECVDCEEAARYLNKEILMMVYYYGQIEVVE